MTGRYEVRPSRLQDDHPYAWTIFDTDADRILAETFEHHDAVHICDALNGFDKLVNAVREVPR